MSAAPGSDDVADDAELAAWSAWGTATISDCNGRQGAMHGRIRPLSGTGLLGRAFPVQIVAGDSATCHRAIVEAPRGSVLVLDAGGYEGRAVWGEILTVAALAQGIRGLVVDGVVRDIAAIRRLGFPVFSRGTCPSGPHKAGGGSWGVPVSCGGVVVAPGDLVVGDDDGVAVVPWEVRHAVATAVPAKMSDEEKALAALRTGTSSAQYFGL